RSRDEALAELRRALDTGRFDLASETLDTLNDPKDDAETVDFAIARARIFLARGDALNAAKVLDAVATVARGARAAGPPPTVREGGGASGAKAAAGKA